MKPETKKILLIGAAGVAGILVLWYLLRQQSAAAANQAVTSAGVQPLQVPAGSNITYNYPPLVTSPATVGTGAAPACTNLCEECDDSASYAAVSTHSIPPQVLASQLANLDSVNAK